MTRKSVGKLRGGKENYTRRLRRVVKTLAAKRRRSKGSGKTDKQPRSGGGKKGDPQAKDRLPETDILATMASEIAEAVELMRPHFPDSDEASLRQRAIAQRRHLYQDGHWPDFAEIARFEAIEAACVVSDASEPTKRLVRAILIDPEKQTFAEIQIEDDYRETQRVLGCRSFTSVAHLSGSLEQGFDAIYASDDALEDRDDAKFWFQVDVGHDPPRSFPTAGLGLAMGVDEDGRGRDVSTSVEELTERVTFTQRKFRGFEIATESDGQLALDIKAPVIDGTNEQH